MRIMDKIMASHLDEYGDEPIAYVSVPARFHLLGEHTWFAQGNTLSVAIGYGIKLCVSKRQDNNFRFFSISLNERRRVSSINLKYRREDRWANSLKAVIGSFYDNGYDVPGLNFTISSDIPSHAGLGTPNALKVATALAVGHILDASIPDETIVKVVEYANTEYLSTHPHTSDILCVLNTKEDCCVKIDNKKKRAEVYPFDLDGHSIILTDSRVPRSIVREELGAKLNECIAAYGIVQGNGETSNLEKLTEGSLKELDLNEMQRKYLSYIIRETQNVEDATQAIKNDDKASLSRIIARSHEGLRDRFEISCPELDWLVKRAYEFAEPTPENLICARMTGKGFGGCTYSILKNKDVPIYKEKLDEYERIFGFTPKFYDVKPADGAKVLLFDLESTDT